MTNWGPLAIIAALFGLGGLQEKYKAPGAGPAEAPKWIDSPIPTGSIGPLAGPSGPKLDVYKEPGTGPISAPRISEPITPTLAPTPTTPAITTRGYTQPTIPGLRVDILVNKPTLTTATLTNPSPTMAAGTIVRKTSGWTWFTPGGPVTSRPPTQEETDSGLGCPEVPDIWTYPGISGQNVKYCANPDCPSNQRQYEAVTAEGPTWLEPTPAQLEQQVDNAGNISYFCRVCRTYQ